MLKILVTLLLINQTTPLTSAHVTKSGTLVAFGAYNPTPAPNGAYAFAPIINVTSSPTINRNGKQIQIGSQIWFSNEKQTPFVFFKAECGTVRVIKVIDGGAGWVNPSVTWNKDGGGSNIILGPPEIRTGVIGYTITNPGSGYTSPPTVTLSGGTTDVNAAAKAIITNGQITSIIPVAGGVAGCGSGYTNPPTVTLSGNATAIAIIGTYINKVPVVSCSNDFTSIPTFTVTDTVNPTRTAIFRPIMSGFSPADVVTYSAPAGWFNANPNYVAPTANNLSVDNWTGRLEGQSGGFKTFNQKLSIIPGVNVGAQPTSAYSPMTTLQNRYYTGPNWGVGGVWPGVITYDDRGYPKSWTNPSSTYIRRWVYGLNGNNQIDGKGFPSHRGRWTLRYKDKSANSSTAMAVWLGAQKNIAHYNLSGPNINTNIPVNVDPRDININANGSITISSLTNSNLGGNYSGAVVSVVGGNGSNAVFTAQVDDNGNIASITTVCSGQRYNNTVQIQIYGTLLNDNIITDQYDLTYPPNLTNWEVDVSANVAGVNIGGIAQWTLDDIRIITPDARTGLAQVIQDDKFAVDSNVINLLSGGRFTHRWMDAIFGWGGETNIVHPINLSNKDNADWHTLNNNNIQLITARTFNTNPNNTNYSWFRNKIYGPQNIFNQGPDGFGKYLTLLPNDMGGFCCGGGAQAAGVVEFITNGNHPFTTGQNIVVWANTGAVPISFTNTTGGFTTPIANVCVYVTGSNSFIVPFYIASILAPNQPWSYYPQIVNGSIDLTNSTPNAQGVKPSWYANIKQPLDDGSVPYEVAGSFAKTFKNSVLWVNIPPAASDETTKEICRKVANSIDISNSIILEWSNEVWNGAESVVSYATSLGRLYGEAMGISMMPYDSYGGMVPTSLKTQDTFIKEWKKLGLDPSRVKTHIGSWWAGPIRTGQALELAQSTGVDVDYVSIASYMSIPNDPLIVAAYSLPGSRPDAGCLPVDSMNDIFRHWMASSLSNINIWRQHYQYCLNWGQPIKGCNLQPGNSNANAPVITSGNYFASLTFVDSNGLETTPGGSLSWNYLHQGSLATLSMPASPSWVSKINIYLGKDSVNNLRLYKTINKTDFAPGVGVPFDIPIPISSVIPPTINNASQYITKIPRLICYEGGATQAVPGGLVRGNWIQHDAFAHPSARDNIYCWYLICQMGDPTLDNSGAVTACYYQMYSNIGYGQMWQLGYGTAQLPGPGYNNKYALDDGHDHNGGPTYPNSIYPMANEMPMLQGLQDAIRSTP